MFQMLIKPMLMVMEQVMFVMMIGMEMVLLMQKTIVQMFQILIKQMQMVMEQVMFVMMIGMVMV